MKTVEVYQDEISGQTFETKEEAIESEQFHREIRETFSFYEPIEDDGCVFANGGYTIQRDEEFYNKILDGIISLTNKYHPWIAKQMGGLSRGIVGGRSWMGRYLGDNDSPLYKWWCLQARICTMCFREHGQAYYAINCRHVDIRKGE